MLLCRHVPLLWRRRVLPPLWQSCVWARTPLTWATRRALPSALRRSVLLSRTSSCPKLPPRKKSWLLSIRSMLTIPSTAAWCSVPCPSTWRLTRTRSATVWLPRRTLTPWPTCPTPAFSKARTWATLPALPQLAWRSWITTALTARARRLSLSAVPWLSVSPQLWCWWLRTLLLPSAIPVPLTPLLSAARLTSSSPQLAFWSPWLRTLSAKARSSSTFPWTGMLRRSPPRARAACPATLSSTRSSPLSTLSLPFPAVLAQLPLPFWWSTLLRLLKRHNLQNKKYFDTKMPSNNIKPLPYMQEKFVKGNNVQLHKEEIGKNFVTVFLKNSQKVLFLLK